MKNMEVFSDMPKIFQKQFSDMPKKFQSQFGVMKIKSLIKSLEGGLEPPTL